MGKSYCLGGRWNSHWVSYFNFSSLLSIRTSSHKWGRWYLPMFLFRDGLLTLMNIDSFISLERFCSSLPTTLKFSSEVVWPEVLLWSCMGGPSKCNFKTLSSPNSCLMKACRFSFCFNYILATMAITSAIHISNCYIWYSKTFKKWSYTNMTITSVITRWFHLPQWHNISHNKGHHHSDITSVTKNNIFG